MRFICLILVWLGFIELGAQEVKADRKNFVPWSVFTGAGVVKPALDYWNDTRLPEIGTNERFSWNLKPGLFLDYYLLGNFRARLGVSYWSDEVNPDDPNYFKSLKISMTSFTCGLVYGFKLLTLDVYAGIKGNVFLVQNKYSLLMGTGNLEDREQGQDYSGEAVLGFDKSLPFNLQAGLEFGYGFGQYYQNGAGEQSQRQKVSVGGPYMGVNLGYRFNPGERK